MKYNDIKKRSPLNTSLQKDCQQTTTHEYGLSSGQPPPLNKSLTNHRSPDELTRRLTFTNNEANHANTTVYLTRVGA